MRTSLVSFSCTAFLPWRQYFACYNCTEINLNVLSTVEAQCFCGYWLVWWAG
jgi:hypothetical protein